MAGVATFSGLLDADSRGDEGSARQPVGKWRGEWTTTARYVEDDTVTFEGSTYRCLIGDRRNKQPDEYPRVWELVARRGSDGREGGDGQSIKGEPGAKGKDGRDGRDGKNGRDGKDGVSIKGDRGDRGLPGLSVQGPKGDKGDAVAGDPGRDGIDGRDGSPGLSGRDGVDGVDGQSITYFDAWQPKTEYPVLAIVTERGSSYIAKIPHRSSPGTRPGVGPDWQSRWGLVARAGKDAVQTPWNQPWKLTNGWRQFPDAFTFTITNDNAGQASPGQPVYVKANGHADLAKANNANTANVVALCVSGMGNGEPGEVRTAGILRLEPGQWDAVTGGVGGLVPGSVYWLSDSHAGVLTTTEPSSPSETYRVGTAFDANTMSINIQQIVVGSGTVPTGAILDEAGSPILDEAGGFILDES